MNDIAFNEEELLLLWCMVKALHDDKQRPRATLEGELVVESLWTKFKAIREAIPAREAERPVA